MRKWVYTFGGGAAEGSRTEIDQLGGKGANLAEMASLGLPVPPGLTIVSDACSLYYKNGKTLCEDLKARFSPALPVSRPPPAALSAISVIPCCSPSAPARAPPCPA